MKGIYSILLAVYAWHPPVGIFVAILGVVGVLVPFLRVQIGRREKAVWTIVMFILVGLELRSIHLYDADQRKSQAEQNTKFQTIADGLKAAMGNSQQQFAATMLKMGHLARVSEESMQQSIGGDSFCYVTPLAGDASGVIRTALLFVGAYPLSNVEIRVVDVKLANRIHASQGYTFQNMFAGDKRFSFQFMKQAFSPLFEDRWLPEDDNTKEYSIFISARNGWFTELLALRREGPHTDGAALVTATYFDGRTGLVLDATKGFPLERIKNTEAWDQMKKLPKIIVKSPGGPIQFPE